MNYYFLVWILALILFMFFGRKCYDLDRSCGMALLLGFLVFIPASLYIVSELWLYAFS